MKVQELMTRDVKVCRASDSANLAAHLMWEHDCGVIPVVDERQRPIGMITDRDVCMAGYTTGRKLDDIRVSEAMSRNVQTCTPDDRIGVAELAMKQRHVRRLPVVDSEQRLVGILSLSDVARAAGNGDGVEAGLTPKSVAETLASVCEPWCSINAQPASRSQSRPSAVCAPAIAR